MGVLLIILGLVLALIPTFFNVIDKDKGKLKLPGKILVVLSFIFVILSIRVEISNSNNEKNNTAKIDSLKLLLFESKLANITENEPSVLTKSIVFQFDSIANRYNYKIIVYNAGQRDALEFQPKIEFFTKKYGQIIDKEEVFVNLATTYELPKRTMTTLTNHIFDLTRIDGEVYILISYKYRDKLQNNYKTNNDFYKLIFDGKVCKLLSTGLKNDFELVEGYKQENKHNNI